ncbi:MAG TPA: hypothetical protein VKV04_07485 [Verrucomicrobiae bacterium]|nr:hypothetical protein [Verrucomicrobiae bacterium]
MTPEDRQFLSIISTVAIQAHSKTMALSKAFHFFAEAYINLIKMTVALPDSSPEQRQEIKEGALETAKVIEPLIASFRDDAASAETLLERIEYELEQFTKRSD